MSTITLYDPTAPAPEADVSGEAAAAQATAQILSGLAGKTIGFIDNAKPNFRFLADEMEALLTSHYAVAKVLRHQKRAASVPAPKEVIQQFADACDVVIAGSGD